MEREKLSSRLGFILLSAGCAIGIGNVWKFPYVTGASGGALFILVYLFFMLILGIPILCMEFAAGRAAQASPVGIVRSLTPDKKGWRWQRWLALGGNLLLMMFYTTVAGWMLRYFVEMASGSLAGLDAEGVAGFFDTMLAQPGQQVFYVGLVCAAGFGVLALGLNNGLEKVTKWMMLALLAIMAVLAVHSLLLPGASEGLRYYLVPDLSVLKTVGLGTIVGNAMNQAFFTLSVGIGSMAVFGSYIGRENSLLKESLHVSLLDTFVALVAGLIIIPACFAYEVQVTAGPSLIFITLPNIFANMAFGQVWGSLFFLFLSFAAMSTVLAVLENLVSMTMELTGWDRKKCCVAGFWVLFILSLPCALGFSVLSHVGPLGHGSTIMDLEDFIVSNLLLPVGSMFFIAYCTWRAGWGWDGFVAEVNAGHGIKFPSWLYHYCKYVLPVIVGAVFVIGLL